MNTPIHSPDGTSISRFASGAMQFGGKADAYQSQQIFEACLEAGATHFDTAHVYTDGKSEEILGRLVAPHRERLVTATKASYTLVVWPQTSAMPPVLVKVG